MVNNSYNNEEEYYYITEKRRYIMISYCQKISSLAYYYISPKEETIVEEYKKYFEWISKNIQKDYYNVKNKKLKYLYQTYVQLEKNLEHKLAIEKIYNNLDLINKEYSYKEKLLHFFRKTENEYENITEYEDKNYTYYDSLSSWYTVKTDMTNLIILNLSRKIKKQLYDDQSKANIEIKYSEENGCYSVNYTIRGRTL